MRCVPARARGEQREQRGDDHVALVDELAVREAHDAITEHRETRVLRAVALERRPCAVVRVAVGLDDEPLRPPEESTS